jgi:uncharacterized membrane protein (GlpM family)
MYRTATFVALGTAVVIAIVHVLAIAGYTPLGMVPVFPAFLIAFACFARFVRDHRGRKITSPFDLIANWPRWAYLLFGFVFLYAGINFAWFMAVTGGATVNEQAGQTYLMDHGRILRALDPAEVRAYQAWNVRLFSGHILPFLVLPGLYFLMRSRKRAPASVVPLDSAR